MRFYCVAEVADDVGDGYARTICRNKREVERVLSRMNSELRAARQADRERLIADYGEAEAREQFPWAFDAPDLFRHESPTVTHYDIPSPPKWIDIARAMVWCSDGGAAFADSGYAKGGAS